MEDGEVSKAIALAWGVVAEPQRGPKRELTLERIVEAAVALADAEGLSAVTMQRLARSFGFSTMAMYRYVPSKDDLHLLMLDASVADESWAIDHGDWRVGLEQWARIVGDAYVRHPWVLDIPLSMEALLLPGQMRAVDAGLRAMRSLPGAPEAKLGVLMMLSLQVRGFASMMRDFTRQGGAVGEPTRRLVCEVAAGRRFPDLAPLLAGGAYFGDAAEEGGSDPSDDFAMVIALVLPGIERALAGSEPDADVERHSPS